MCFRCRPSKLPWEPQVRNKRPAPKTRALHPPSPLWTKPKGEGGCKPPPVFDPRSSHLRGRIAVCCRFERSPFLGFPRAFPGPAVSRQLSRGARETVPRRPRGRPIFPNTPPTRREAPFKAPNGAIEFLEPFLRQKIGGGMCIYMCIHNVYTCIYM